MNSTFLRKSRLQNCFATLFPSMRRAKRQGARRRFSAPEGLEARRVMAGDVSGTVFHDMNANGVDEAAEDGLEGWTVFIDNNGNGQFNSGELSAVTDRKGKFTISNVPAGNQTIYEIPQDGFFPTPGFSDHQTVRVRDDRETKIKFPNVLSATGVGAIAGTVFEDVNENTIHDATEDEFLGWTLFLDLNGDGTLNLTEPTATTDSDGDFLFSDVEPGSYTVYEIPQGGYLPTVGGLFPLDGASDHRQVEVTAGTTSQVAFGNLIPNVGTIQGIAWNDGNGDATRGADETSVAGRTVYVDLNENGSIEAGEPTRVTDTNGFYSFENIHAGRYRVTEVVPTGQIDAMGHPSSQLITVSRGSQIDLDFYTFVPVPGSIEGTVWNDANGNSLYDADESPLSDWQIYLDLNANGILDETDLNTATDAEGNYTFADIAYGNVVVRAVLPTNWAPTAPPTGINTFRLLNGENRTNVNFGNRERIGDIVGTVWNDNDGNGVVAPDETGVADWTVFLDLNGDGFQDESEPATLTDAAGNYAFLRLPEGTYSVTEILHEGWINTEGRTAQATVTVVTGGSHRADFFNLVPVFGGVQGVVWSDNDSNSARADTELGVEGWQVYADLNDNSVVDEGEPTTITDSAGAYTLDGVPYGTNSIREIVQPGYTPTNRVGGRATVFVFNGQTQAGIDFGNHEVQNFVIEGIAFHDANRDGVRSEGEVGLSGQRVYLDLNSNGILDPAEPTTTTSSDLFFTPAVNESGKYSFTHLARGTYQVREIPSDALNATPDAARVATVTIGPGSNAVVDFANVYRANEIHGFVYDDLDSDQVQDEHEPGRSGVGVYLDYDRDDVHDEDEPYEISGDDGSYSFRDLTPGTYIVREDHSTHGPVTYPTTGGGVLWPEGVDHNPIGNVSPTTITTTLADGESHRQTVTLTLPDRGSIADTVDVFLLFDDTGSFTSNSPIVREAFPTIIGSLQAAMPGVDLGFGVGRFEEYANFGLEYSTGRPFILNQPVISAGTSGFQASIQAALDRMAPGYGGDAPETDIEALYQLVTGLGFDGNNNGTVLDSGPAGLASTQLTPGDSGDVPGFDSFTPDSANNVLPAEGTIGGGGFRAGALPVVLLATDTGFAYQPQGETTVTGVGGVTLPLERLIQSARASTPFSSGAGIQQTITGLNALGALVIGLGTNDIATSDPRQSLESLAVLTGAVNQTGVTIANGTTDPISPGDPLYFQIESGFGTTVADGIVQAIQTAVTSISMDITVRSSDPRVHIVNHSGTLFGVGAGESISFDVEFVGDGKPHRFDLQFVREGTNVVIGSIPVVIGTPIVGEGYHYDELEDGEVHHSSHFGHYVANVAPTFVAGDDVIVAEDSTAQIVAGWASEISPGPLSEAAQTVDFIVTTDNESLFSVLPSVSADGTLAFTPAPNAFGTTQVTVVAHDNGGVGFSGADTSAPQSFSITVTPVADAPVVGNDAFATLQGEMLVLLTADLLANDSDADGDTLSPSVSLEPSHGSILLQADGSLVYTPNAGFAGEDRFEYIVNDGTLTSTAASVTITVIPQNHAPIATSDAFSTLEDVSLVVAAPGLLANDMDVDTDGLSVSLVVPPTHGLLTLSTDGSFVYTPDANYFGTDSFSYRATDGAIDSNVATVSLTVNPAVTVGAVKFLVTDQTSLANYQYDAAGNAITSLNLTARNLVPTGIASNADGTIQWVVDESGDVFVYNNAGAQIGSWQARNVGKPQGITVWNNDLWIVDASKDRVHRFTNGANVRSGRITANSSFALTGANRDATDLVTDGTKLWVVNNGTGSDAVFRYSIAGGLEGSWNLSPTHSNATGITLDPAAPSHLWLVDASTDRVYQYDHATTRLSGSQEPSVSFPLAVGNTNPQGIADPLPMADSGSGGDSGPDEVPVTAVPDRVWAAYEPGVMGIISEPIAANRRHLRRLADDTQPVDPAGELGEVDALFAVL